MLPMILRAAMMFQGQPVLIPAASGRISVFGGPNDQCLREHEADWTGSFRVCNLGLPSVRDGDPYYVAMRWFDPNRPPPAFGRLPNWDIKVWYSRQRVAVMHPDRTRLVVCWIADWGPNSRTGRVADLGPLVAAYLGIDTDDRAEFGWVDRDTPTGAYRLRGKIWEREEVYE